MLNFDITLNIYVFLLLIAGAAMIGHMPRSKQIARKQRKIAELEREMVQAHAELLESQRDFCQLEASLKNTGNPVIPLKSNKWEEPQQKNNRATGTDQAPY
ncbi:MAG TPA: hypothetical protein VNW04_17995 [Puia sp.]|jgi:hypothetical protein|nr:hypothetical protein [Puia sp.]